MSKIIVLGGGSDQISLILELRKKGFSIILVDYYSNPPAKQFAHKHYVVSTLDVDSVLKIAKEEQIDYIITACIDQAILTMAFVAEELRIKCPFSFDTALNVTNKSRMKERMLKAGIPTSNYKVVKAGVKHHTEGLKYPLVVKPSDSNGSYGVKKVESKNELDKYLKKAQKISRSGIAIVEEFREGVEVSIDAFIKHKKAKILMMTTSKKIANANSNFPICQSHYPAKIGTKAKKKVEYIANQIADAFGLDNTPLIIQVICCEDEVSVIEFGARIAGGSKHHLIKEVTGFDIMKAYVDSFFNWDIELDVNPTKDHVSINYVYTRRGIFSNIENIDILKDKGIIKDYYMYKTPGMNVDSHFASRDRICSFMVKGHTENEMDDRIISAVKKIRVLNEKNDDFMLRNIY